MKRLLRSLRLHILLPALIMVLLLVFLITMTVSRAYMDMIFRQESDKNAALFDVISRQIKSTVDISIADARHIAIDERITAYVRHQFGTDAELMHARVDCRDCLSVEINRHSAIYGLLFMRPDGSLFGALPYRNVFSDDQRDVLLPGEIVDQVLGLPSQQTVWIGPVSGAVIYGYESAKLPENVVIAAWKSASVKAGVYYTLMLMDDLAFEEMLNILPDAVSRGGPSVGGGPSAVIHLFSADGRELFRMGGDSGLDMQTLALDSNNGTIVKNNRNESYCVFSMPLAVGGGPSVGDGPSVEGGSSAPGWTLVREVSMEDSLQSIRGVQRKVWLLVGAALLVALGLYCLWLRRFMRGFNALKDDIIRLGQGNLAQAPDAPMVIEEFESMRRELNRAGLLLNRHMETVRRMEREKLELEMNDLHSILAPHMIFNSISAIRWMATFMGAEPVSDMLIELGAVIRPVLRQWRVQWTIREELEHIGHYAKLMDLRYANNFKLECQVDEGLDEELIPQFTLQPLIENAGQHGGNPDGPLVTTVRVMDDGDWIRLTVADNGDTIQPEKIEEIRENLRAGARDHGIGLINVYSRLVLCKGGDSTLDIEALPEGGTMVTLRWKRDAGTGDKGV